MATSRTAFGHDTTTDEVLEGIDLSGKTVLITGGTSGLGAESARALASKGARVVITARTEEKGAAAAARISQSVGSKIDFERLELGSFASIRACAEQIRNKYPNINILLNNAGVMASPYTETEDGFEQQFGANHLGHFLLTGLIAPCLIAGAPARVVSVSSRAHQMSPVVFDDILFKEREYNKWAAYGQSKTANVLFAVELDRRLKNRNVRAFALHPGVIETELSRHMDQTDHELLEARAAARGGPMRTKTVPAGAATSVYAATAPELEGQGGLYLEDCHVAEVSDKKDGGEGVCSYAVDPDAAKRLWSVSEDLIGEKFDLS